MDQVFILFFSTYTVKVFNWRERISNKALARLPTDAVGDRDLCTIYTDIANFAANKPGRALRCGGCSGEPHNHIHLIAASKSTIMRHVR